MTLPTARRPTNTLSHGSLRPSKSRTMVPWMVAQNCTDTSRDRARNVAKSWRTQDSSHLPKARAAAAIRGNVDVASSYVMYNWDTNSAFSGARLKAA